MENLDYGNNKNVSLSLIAEYGASDSDTDDTETHSDAAELSEMVLKNNIINACAHGPTSRPHPLHGVETSRHMIIDSVQSGVVEYEVTEYRDVDSDSDSSDSSESSDRNVDSVKDIDGISSGDENEGKSDKPEIPKVRGELSLEDLPPIEDLAISLPPEQMTQIGTIFCMFDKLVVVQGFRGTPAVDLESILFVENGAKALGKVFDVFGPVTDPHYCVRFNSMDHIKARGLKTGMAVYIAPRTEHTNYVLVGELMKEKGSDASWLNDIEPPPHQVEFSDDEEERRANRARKEKQKQEESDGETSKTQAKKQEPKRNQRPSESSSRFGSGPSRGRNPFSASSRRNNPNPFTRYTRPWGNMDMRTPPPHPNEPIHPPFAPNFPPSGPPMFGPPFNLSTPPPFMGHAFQFGGNPRMPGAMPPMSVPPPFRQSVPVFGSSFYNVAGPQPQWVNGPPPPPGT